MHSVFKTMNETMVMFSCPILGILFVFFYEFFVCLFFVDVVAFFLHNFA